MNGLLPTGIHAAPHFTHSSVALRSSPAPSAPTALNAAAPAAHRLAPVSPALAGVCMVPLTLALMRRTERAKKVSVAAGGETGARGTGKTTAKAMRSSTKDRLKELEDLVGDDEEVSSIDDVVVPLEPQSVPAAVAGARFSQLPEELPRAIPFLPEPSYRSFAANVPGDEGFDPLGLCTDITKFVDYREAELKHGRLAMLAALAWPLAEVGEQAIAAEDSTITGIPDLLADSGGRMLPQLTGGMADTFVEIFAALTLLIGAVFEVTQRRRGTEPGDVGFDPATLKGWRAPPFVQSFIPRNRSWMSEAEIKHSRLAMMAVIYDIVDEALTGNPVVEDTEYFFHRIDDKLLSWEYWTPWGGIPDELPVFSALLDEFPQSI